MMFTSRKLLTIRVLVSLLLLFSWFANVSGAMTGEEIVAKVVNRIQEARDLSAGFEKSFYWKLVEETQRINGRFYLKKPNKFRVETGEQTVVTDGDTVWTYLPEDKQVIVSRWEQWQDPLNELLPFAERFEPTYVGMEKVEKNSCYLVKLLAVEKEEEIIQIELWVAQKKWLPLRVKYLDLNGNVTSYLLSDVKVNSDLRDSLFRFKPPKEAEVVDMFEPNPSDSEKK